MISKNLKTSTVSSELREAIPFELQEWRDSIPPELRALRQWVLWGPQGTQSKVPFQVGGIAAKSSDPSTWNSFEACWQAYLNNSPRRRGVGFVFSPDDSYCGIDLDNCVCPQSLQISPWALEILEIFRGKAYAEISPSQTGVKLIGVGKLPPGARNQFSIRQAKPDWLRCDKDVALEWYEQKRYFALTGDTWDGFESIDPNGVQAEIDRLHAEVLPRLATNSTRQKQPSKPQATNLQIRIQKFLESSSAEEAIEGQKGSNPTMSVANALVNGFGLSREQALKWMNHYNHTKCHPPWSEKELAHKVDDAIAKGDPKGRPPGFFLNDPPKAKPPQKAIATGSEHIENLSDLGNAQRFARLYSKDVRYCSPRKLWFVWQGSHWAEDQTNRARCYAQSISAEVRRQAPLVEDDKEKTQLLRWAHHSEQSGRISACLQEAAALPGIAIQPEDFNQHPWLLACPNGTIDLRTGELRTAKRSDLLTQCSPVRFNPEAKCPRFDAFLQETFQGDSELIDWVLRWFGYCLTGSTREQVVPVFVGPGGNGKGVLVKTAMHVLGSMSHTAPESLLIEGRQEHPAQFALLFGKRWVVASETNKGRSFNAGKLKMLTGEDAVICRGMGENFWEFQPTHKLTLATNHLPEFDATDYGLIRRLRPIPFNHKPENPDDKLTDRLRSEGEGILGLFVRACLDWQQRPLTEGFPAQVGQVLNLWSSDQDILLNFLLEEFCFVDERGEDLDTQIGGLDKLNPNLSKFVAPEPEWIRAGELWKDFQKYAGNKTSSGWTQAKLGKRLKEFGIKSKRSNGSFYLLTRRG